jgi:hypothetical protein
VDYVLSSKSHLRSLSSKMRNCRKVESRGISTAMGIFESIYQ